MSFQQQRRAQHAKRGILKAVVNAQFFNEGLAASKMMVDQAWTGKQTSSPRLRMRRGGRSGRAHKRTSQLWVRLREMTPDESARIDKRLLKTYPLPGLDPRGY
jgi:ribosomal protein L22